MRGPRPLIYRITAVTLFLMLAGFIVLSGDVVARLWMTRQGLGTAIDAAVLLAYESARALTTALALLLAVASHRQAGTAGRRAFTLLLLFLALWYTKAFAFENFPGYLQERLALWLFDHGVPRRAAAFVFGQPVWAAWLALGALLRLSVEFPATLDAAVIERSGERDRAGMMRGVSLAGADVGAWSRRASVALLRRGAFKAAPVWSIAAAAGTLHAVTGVPVVKVALSTLFVVLVVMGLTNLRAATMEASAVEQRRALWMVQAALAAVAAFATTAILSATANALTEGLSFGLAALAPPVALMGMSFGITGSRPPDPRPAITNTLLVGVAAVAMAMVFVVATGVTAPLLRPPIPVAAAAFAALVSCVLLWSRIRRLAVRLATGFVALP